MAMTVWRTGAWSLHIVKRSDVTGFEVLPRWWVVERMFRGSVLRQEVQLNIVPAFSFDPPPSSGGVVVFSSDVDVCGTPEGSRTVPSDGASEAGGGSNEVEAVSEEGLAACPLRGAAFDSGDSDFRRAAVIFLRRTKNN